ncbi:MAG: PD-(D/E)XK nuclease family protein [Caldilineaceae bacterium]|nr:PD-(D/E)XK nuclease family protein [Caldilineaceae bacterium]
MSVPYKPRFCPHCHARAIIRKGTRRNQHRVIPLYLCKSCFRYFSTETIARVKYPPHVIIKALSYYNLGYSQSEVSALIARHHRLKVPRRTISLWLERYKPICTFNRLRAQAQKLYRPEEMILSYVFKHRQTYGYKLHLAKLALLKRALVHPQDYAKLQTYLHTVMGNSFPHHMFVQEEVDTNKPKLRSSQVNMNLPPVARSRKANLANDLALLGLVLAKRNKERHPQIQDFMLINDSSTLACEVPVYLTPDNIRYFLQAGFRVPLTEQDGPITGHIDIVQVRNGYIHILDYKPEAQKINPVSQLTIYALALASHTKLPLRLFKCAWFDEKDYFEFYPLHCVYPRYVR